MAVSHANRNQIAQRWIGKSDPVMRRLISQVGPFELRLERDRFWALARSIVSQQISVGAARTIQGRLKQLFAPEGFSPAGLLRLTPEELRACGISRQKSTYLLDLAEKTHSGEIELRRIGRLSDEQVIERLTQVKGIGRWTAEMFLIFSLGRLDVLPVDDLGVRNAIRLLYGLAEMPDKATCIQIASPWRPYASIASWYCWRSLELPKTSS